MFSNQPLLLKSSKIFEESTLIDNIRQSIIDIINNPPENEIYDLLKESITYLDYDLDYKTLDELFILISSCFSSLPGHQEGFLSEIFTNSQKNANRLIIFAIIFSQYNESASFPNLSDFINDIVKQIFDQIQNPKGKFIICENEITPKYVGNFVIDILLITELNDTIISAFLPFILHQECLSNERIKNLTKKISKYDLLAFLPECVILDKRFFTNLSEYDMPEILPKLNEQMFLQILPLIEETFGELYLWNSLFVSSILDKYIEYKISFNKNEKISSLIKKSLTKSAMKPSFWSYFSENEVILPDSLSLEIQQFPNPSAALKIMPNIQNLPQNVVAQGLYEANDLKIFEKIVDFDFQEEEIEIMSKKEFWIHFFSIISSAEEEYSDGLLRKSASLFEKNVAKQNSYDIIESMIFEKYPTTNNGNHFLFDLIDYFSYGYKEKIYENKEILFKKVIDNKIIPLPSFWVIFHKYFINSFLQTQINNPMILYAYAFSFPNNTESDKQYPNIILDPLKIESNSKFIIEFIKNKELNYITKLNEDTLHIVAYAYILTCSDYIKVKGLTTETFIPFLAICIHINSIEKIKSKCLSTENIKLFLKSCKLLPKSKSQLSIESLDSIVSHLDILFGSCLLYSNFEFEFLDIVINQLIDNTYRGDKLLLLEKIFLISRIYPEKIPIKCFFDKNGFKFFKYMIKNINKIDGFDKLQDLSFNFNAIDQNKFVSFATQTIQDSLAYNDIINMLYFIEKFDKQFHQLKITNYKNLAKIYKDNLKRMNLKEFYVLEEFIKKNNLGEKYKELSFNHIPINTIDVNKVINDILEDPQPEKNDLAIELLFKILMKEQSIAISYYTILFEKLNKNLTITPASIVLQKYLDQYTNDKFLFTSAFKRIYNYDKKGDSFVRKPNYESKSHPISKLGLSIISKLLKKGTHQAFFCLKSIASSFPFLFTKNPQKIFEKILPKLESFSLIFTIQDNADKSLVNDLKVSLSAFSFLRSLLISTKILEAFVPWVFENITSFTQYQVMAMSCIIQTLFLSKKIRKVMLALSITYEFPKIASKLLEMDVPKDIHLIYKRNIYVTLDIFYDMLNKLNNSSKMIFIDELTFASNPFQLVFNNCSTIYPQIIDKILFVDIHNKEVNSFQDNIERERPYWTCFEFGRQYGNYEETSELIQSVWLSNLKDAEACSLQMYDFSDITYKYYSKYIRYCAMQPDWIYKWIIKRKTFPCFNEHRKVLKKVKNKLNELDKSDNDDKRYNDHDIDYYFLDQFCQADLFNLIIKEIITNDINNNELILNIFNSITKDKIGLTCFLDILIVFIMQNKDDIKSIIKLLRFIGSTRIACSDDFIFYLNDFIELSLSPEFRSNVSFLWTISSILMKAQKIPARASQIVGFMLALNKPELFTQIIEFSHIIGSNNLINVQQSISKILKKQLHSNKTISISAFKTFMQITPSFAKENMEISAIVFDNAIKEYNENKKSETLDFIFTLMNEIAPKRNENQLIIPNDEVDFSMSYTSSRMHSLNQLPNQSILKQPPQNLVDTNPAFWNLYGKHISFFNDIVTNDKKNLDKIKFLEDFPELISFEKRLSYFRQKMKEKIIDYETLEINVNRSNVLINSFEIMNNMSRNEWLGKIKVKFEGESGIDMGGLTKEWFTLIVKDIFNPNFALFVLSGNNSYQPNQFSGINQEHIDFFRFSGKIIARAIIQGQCINAHFCRSFCRQILHCQVKLKDLEEIDENIYKSLEIILKEDVEPLALNFTIDVNEYGSNKTILLKENGDEIDVTNENKVEYTNLYASYHLRKSIINQVTAFCEGFNYLISHDEIKIFSPNELDLLICGIPIIDVEDLKENTSFSEPYHSEHPVIEMFFNVISRWDPDNLAKFLLFLTGSSQVPVNGFKDYADAGSPVTIAPGGDRSRLCVAHTCFNTLDLPEYENEDEMNDKLLQSIQETEFGIL